MNFINLIKQNPKANFLIVLISFALMVPGILLIKKDFTYKIWHQEGDPLLESFNQFQQKFGNDDSLIIGITNKNGLFNLETFQTIQKLTDIFWTYRDVARVDTLLNWQFIDSNGDELTIEPVQEDFSELDFKLIKNKFKNDARALGTIISKDLNMTLMTLTAKSDATRKLDYTALSQTVLTELKKVNNPNIKFTRVGNITFTDMFEEITFDDLLTLFPMVVILFGCVLYYMFGCFWSILFAYSVAGCTILMTMGISGFLGQAFNLVSSATPTILLTVAMADAIHLMTLYFREVDRGSSITNALQYSLEKNFGPTLLTSLTTSVGFLSFSNSKILPISILGIQVAIGVALAWLLSYLLFPVLIKYYSPKKHKLLSPPKRNLSSKAFTHMIVKRKFPIFLLAILFSVLGFYFTQKLQVNMNARQQFKKDHPVNTNIDHIESHYGPSETLEMMIHGQDLKNPSELKRIEKLEQWFLAQDFVEKVESPLKVLRNMNLRFNGSKDEFNRIPENQDLVAQLFFTYNMFTPSELNLFNQMAEDYKSLRFTVYWNKYSSADVLNEIEIIKKKTDELDLKAEVTGKAPIFHKLTPYVVETFLRSFLIAFIAITIVLMIVLKSIRLGLLSLIPNLMPLFIGGAVVYFFKLNFDIGIVMVGAVALGIAVDDSIHFLFNFKRNYHNSVEEALDNTIHHTFPSLFFTTLILVLGFGSFTFAEYIPNALFGSMTALILIVALSADFIILPACISIFYERKS